MLKPFPLQIEAVRLVLTGSSGWRALHNYLGSGGNGVIDFLSWSLLLQVVLNGYFLSSLFLFFLFFLFWGVESSGVVSYGVGTGKGVISSLSLSLAPGMSSRQVVVVVAGLFAKHRELTFCIVLTLSTPLPSFIYIPSSDYNSRFFHSRCCTRKKERIDFGS